jgi:hypothetical protein
MRKSAYSLELIERIRSNLEPLILPKVESNDNILVLGAGIDLKGLSCFNIVLDILESNNMIFDSIPFTIKTDFDEYPGAENLQLLNTFFGLEIEEWVNPSYLDLIHTVMTDNNIPKDMLLFPEAYKRYFSLNYSANIRANYTKVFIVNGHKLLDDVRESGVLDNNPLFFNNTRPIVREKINSFGRGETIFEIFPNMLLPSKAIDFNEEAITLINSTNIKYSSKIVPSVGLDLTKTKTELRIIVKEWIDKFPSRVQQILNYEVSNNISYFTLRNSKEKMKLTDLIKYLEL